MKKQRQAPGKAPQRIQTRNVTKGAGGKRIAKPMYDAMRKAILKTLPARGEGMLFTQLMRDVDQHLPKDLYAGASVPWYATTVKLDLEARGLIERVPGAVPQRLRRKQQRT